MRILLIDDHKLFSKSIQMSLEIYDDFEKVDTVDEITKLQYPLSDYYDIVLVDINLTTLYEQDGLTLAEEIIAEDSAVKIVMLTGYSKPMYSHRAKEMGARGFIDKSIDIEQLVFLLKNIDQGGIVFTTDDMIDILTDREVAILKLVRQGLSIEEICEQAFVSKRTVSNHLGNIFSKLAVNNRQEAILKAEMLGYFSPD